MGGGSIIINQAEVIQTAMSGSSFPAPPTTDCSIADWNRLLAKALTEWTKEDCLLGLELLGNSVQDS